MMAVVGWDLERLHLEYEAFIEAGGNPDDFTPSNQRLEVIGNRVAVSVCTHEALTYERVAEGGVVEEFANWDLIHDLETTGIEVTAWVGWTAGARLPFDAIDDLAARTDIVRFVWPAYTVEFGGSSNEDAPSQPTVNWELVRAAFGANRDGPMVSVGWDLTVLYFEYRAAVDAGIDVRDFVPSNGWLSVRGDRVRVGVCTTEPLTYERVVEGGVVEEVTNRGLIEALEASGLEITAVGRYRAGAWLAFDAIDDIAALSFVRFVRPAYSWHWVGDVTSQGDLALRSDEVRAAWGIEGTGITVGVIADSYDQDEGAPTHAADDIESEDLPEEVQVCDDSRSAGNDEGRAMLQIVHDVTPGAKLLFHTNDGDESDAAAAIRELRDRGANVIVDDFLKVSELRGFARNGGTGDVARLYDSAGDDTFTGYSGLDNQGVLVLGNGVILEAWEAFELAWAFAEEREDTDTAILQEGTVWEKIGGWEQ